MTGISDAARRVLLLALEARRDDPRAVRLLRGHLERLDAPLRIAIAGKVKAGKSTLLNALVGEQVAPTDAGECTRVVTWYRDGHAPRIMLHPVAGPPAPLPVTRRDGALVIDMGGVPAERVDRLVVDWPSQGLRAATLVDTPGIASTSTGVSQRTVAFLDPDDEAPAGADAVVYLMRHLHATDATFLESFRDQGVARATAVNTVAVISRADEIGGGRVDSLFSARAIAQRYRTDPTVRGLCQDVVAVAGLVAETGRTLHQAEYAAIAELSRTPREQLEVDLLSADRFLAASGGSTADVRSRLLDRFGIFGIRLATALVRQGATSPSALATELVARSGLHELQEVLYTQFAQRRDLLKARSALLAVESVLRTDRDARLSGEVERILAGAHEFVEVRTLAALRSGSVALPRPATEEAERLLGAAGTAPAARLGLPPGAPVPELRRAGLAALAGWQRRAVNPLLDRGAVDGCRAVVRSCEGILAGLPR
ncbi:MAG: dynamin family protein [Pseudonocardia sp.]|nr:dynamin family protein [Pseudonocardia sp.]